VSAGCAEITILGKWTPLLPSAGIALFNYFFVGASSALARLDASPALLAHTDEVIE
jgi:hypothetical protein